VLYIFPNFSAEKVLLHTFKQLCKLIKLNHFKAYLNVVSSNSPFKIIVPFSDVRLYRGRWALGARLGSSWWWCSPMNIPINTLAKVRNTHIHTHTSVRGTATPWILRGAGVPTLCCLLYFVSPAYMAMYNFYSHQGCSPRKCRRRGIFSWSSSHLSSPSPDVSRKYCNIKLYTNIIYKQQNSY